MSMPTVPGSSTSSPSTTDSFSLPSTPTSTASEGPEKGPKGPVDLSSNSQRAGATASAGPGPMAPRKQALKAMTKHAWGALKHGALGAGHAVEKLAHDGTAALSRPESGMAREHEIAGTLTRPLVASEFGMAKVHTHAVRRAFVDFVKKTRTYDPGHVAEQLAPDKEIKSSSQALKNTMLGTPGKTNGLGERKYEMVFPEIPAPAKRQSIEVPAEAAAHKPHTTAVKGLLSAVRSTARGVSHKIMQGLHTTGAAVWSNQMSVSFTHKQAAAKHADRANGHFTKADYSIRLSGRSTAIAARQDWAKTSKLVSKMAGSRPERTESTPVTPSAVNDTPAASPQKPEARLERAKSSPHHL
jgi:hypothetical protein